MNGSSRERHDGTVTRALCAAAGVACSSYWLACHAPTSPTAEAPRRSPIVLTTPSATASGAGSSTTTGDDDETPTSAATAATDPRGGPRRIVVPIRPGGDPCTLVFEAAFFGNDEPDWFSAGGIGWLATEDSPGCAAGVLFDLSAEPSPDPNGMEAEALAGGIFQRPGRPESPEASEQWNHLEDLSFDGYLDVCVVAMTGAYNYSQRCWIFEPKSRLFVAHAGLAELIFMTVDAKTKTIKSGHRVGGPVYTSAEHAWIGDQLVELSSETTYLGEQPDGASLPPGYGSYVIRHERRGGKLVKVFDGARR